MTLHILMSEAAEVAEEPPIPAADDVADHVIATEA